MDLLTDAQRAQIKAALHDVTDTFCKTEIAYRLYLESVDRFNETNETGAFTAYTLMALVEYADTDGDKIKRTVAGAEVYSDIKLTLNYQDLDNMGLINAYNTPVFSQEKDYFTANGMSYRVVYVGMDGPLDEKNVLVIIHGELEPKKS